MRLKLLLNSLASAFLMYSRIPVPSVAWKEENRRYALCFFPLIGLVIGSLLVGWRLLCTRLGWGQLLFAAGGMLLPLVVTGGIHMDGFCDVTDARASCAEKEKRLAIMSDSHIGAFAAIYACVYLIIQTALFAELTDLRKTTVIAFGYVLSRTFSGLAAVTFHAAKHEGALQSFVRPAHKHRTIIALLCTMAAVCAGMIAVRPLTGVVCIAAAAVVLCYYRRMAYRLFGGITGDTAGWFLQVCEMAMLAAAVLSPD